MKPHPRIIVLHLTPAPGNWQAPPDKRLARFLKCALRAFGFRCVSCAPVADPEPVEDKEP